MKQIGWAGDTGLAHRRIWECGSEAGQLLEVESDQASQVLVAVLVKSASYDRTHEEAMAGEH